MNVGLLTDVSQTVGDTIEPTALGGEYLAWTGFGGWQVQAEEVGIQHLRWPSGINAEDRMINDAYAYDIASENLVENWPLWNGNPRPGLSEMFAYANAQDISFAIIIPTARYAELGATDMDAARAWIKSDVETFVQRLANGDFGALPDDFILEIGAEYYSTDFWEANPDMPNLDVLYGEVFAEVVAALSQEEAASGQDLFSINVQMGRFQSNDDTGGVQDGEAADSDAFLAAYATHNVLDAIDGVIWHRYVYTYDQIAHHTGLPGSASAASEETLAEHHQMWINTLGHDLDLIAAWASPDVDSTGASDTDPHFDFGPRSGANVLQMFSTLMASGVDTATIYGIDSPWAGALSSGGQTASDYQIYYAGQTYGLMSESLVGTRVVDGFQSNFVTVDATNTVIENTHINTNAFASDTRAVTFLSAGNLPDEGATTTFEMTGLSGAQFVRTTMLTPLGTGTYASGAVSEFTPDIDGTGITFDFTDDFQIARVEHLTTLDTGNALPDSALFWNLESGRFLATSTEENDTIVIDALLALAGASFPNAIVQTGLGNDHITGSDAGDIILGGAGNDTISGGAGDDLLIGEDVDPALLDAFLLGTWSLETLDIL